MTPSFIRARYRTLLVTRDDGAAHDVDPDLIETATAEALRACIFAADVVLIPETLGVLPLAAVIAHDVRQAVVQNERRRERGGDAPFRFQPGRFVPFPWEGARSNELLQPYLRVDLGGGIPATPQTMASASAAIDAYPPDAVVMLTADENTVQVLRAVRATTPVWYFESLVAAGITLVSERLGSVREGLVNLESNLRTSDEQDAESDRATDEGLERFVPFGVLLQDVLWRPEPSRG